MRGQKDEGCAGLQLEGSVRQWRAPGQGHRAAALHREAAAAAALASRPVCCWPDSSWPSLAPPLLCSASDYPPADRQYCTVGTKS